MTSVNDVFNKWWKKILLVVVVSTVVIGVLVYLKPVQYLSVTTAVPASSFASDKSAIFNENIQALYQTLGSSDDLDRIVGTSTLDTVYTLVAEKYNIWDHYKIKETQENFKYRATRELKQNVRVIKSGYGELKVKVWDTDKNLAPQLANAILDELQKMHQNIQGVSNNYTLKGLKEAKLKLQQQADTGRINTAITTLDQYDKLILQYQMMVDSKQPVLIVVEKAKSAIYPDRPRRKLVIGATILLSFLFSFLVAFLIERSKMVEA